MPAFCVTLYLDVQADSESDALDVVNALDITALDAAVLYVDVSTDVSEASGWEHLDDDETPEQREARLIDHGPGCDGPLNCTCAEVGWCANCDEATS